MLKYLLYTILPILLVFGCVGTKKPRAIYADGQLVVGGVAVGSINMNNNGITNVAKITFIDGTEQATAGGAGGSATNVTAPAVSYANSSYGALSNVDLALDYLLYAAPTVSLSGGNTYEQGYVVTNVPLSWICNKTMTGRSLSTPVPIGDRDRGAGGSGSYTHTNALLAANTTYTITVTDGVSNKTSATSVGFSYKKYWGVSALDTNVLASTITGWSSEFDTTKGIVSKSLSPSGEYVYAAYLTSDGASTAWSDGSFVYDVVDQGTISLTNSYGAVNSYRLYRWPNVQTRTVSVTLY